MTSPHCLTPDLAITKTSRQRQKANTQTHNIRNRQPKRREAHSESQSTVRERNHLTIEKNQKIKTTRLRPNIY